MFSKQALIKVLVTFLIILISSPVIYSQLKDICKFKGVELPFRLKHQDSVLKKDKYDIELLKLENPTRRIYLVRIKKGGKVLCQIEGEKWIYGTIGDWMWKDPDIPDKPTMKIRKSSADKLIIFIIETGKKNKFSPFLRLRFKMEYEE